MIKCPNCNGNLKVLTEAINGEKFKEYSCFGCGIDYELVAKSYLESLQGRNEKD